MSAKLPPKICLNKLPMYGVAEKFVWWWVCKPISLICFGPNQSFNCKKRIYGDCLTGPLMMENVAKCCPEFTDEHLHKERDHMIQS